MTHYDVQITDAQTGETRSYTDPYLDEHGPESEYPFYIWEEGNYSCDCNRSLFFARAINTPEDQIDEVKCGLTRFRVVIKLGDEIVYSDGEPVV